MADGVIEGYHQVNCHLGTQIYSLWFNTVL